MVALGLLERTSRTSGGPVRIAHGRINLLWSGLEDRDGPEVRLILWEVYGIRAIPAAGCLMSQPRQTYLERYNHNVLTDARERFGQHFYERVYEEARWNIAEGPGLTEEQRNVQSARYDIAMPKPSERDLPLWFPRTDILP